MGERKSEFTLTVGDKKKLDSIKSALEEAIQTDNREGQIAILFDSQQRIMEVLSWLVYRGD